MGSVLSLSALIQMLTPPLRCSSSQARGELKTAAAADADGTDML